MSSPINRTALGLLLGGCLLAAVSVDAQPKTSPVLTPQARYDRMCKAEGEYGHMVAQSRDEGIPLTTMFSNLRKIPKTPEVRREFERRILAIYDAVILTPERVQRVYENACLTSSARPQE